MAKDSDQRLVIAVWAAVIEVLGQVVLLTMRGALGGAPLRVVFLLAKLPFCWLALRRNAGGYLAVMLYEFGGIVAAISADGSFATRVAIGLAASAVMVMLGRAVSAFPTVEWRR